MSIRNGSAGVPGSVTDLRSVLPTGRLILATTIVLLASQVNAQPVFQTTELGLDGPEYHRPSGDPLTSAHALTDTGRVIGNSDRFDSKGAGLGSDSWVYGPGATSQAGLRGPGFEQSNGSRQSYARFVNEAGQVAGISYQYGAHGDAVIGQAGWFHDAAATVQIGFTGKVYQAKDGGLATSVDFLAESGAVLGGSKRFDPKGRDLGHDPWLFEQGVTRRIGLEGADYQSCDGYRVSVVGYVEPGGGQIVPYMTPAGYVVGTTNRYDHAGAYHGADAWLYSAGRTDRIGLGGLGYERADGFRQASVTGVNDAGQAIGVTTRFDTDHQDPPGSAMDDWRGYDAWLYAGGASTLVGLTGAGYEQANGFRESHAQFLNGAGQVAGWSARVGRGGYDTWLFSNGKTERIGLDGEEYETPAGFRANYVQFLNDAGQVVGHADRFRSAAPGAGNVGDFGQDVWRYDDGQTIRLGLTGAGYETAVGYRRSVAEFQNQQGLVAGSSYRFDGSSPGNSSANPQGKVTAASQAQAGQGVDTWVFDGSTTVQVGLTGAGYESADGERESYLTLLNASGQLAGRSYRLDENGKYLGEDAWLYDALSRDTYSFTFSIRPDDGFALSSISYLDDEYALGSFRLFDQQTGADLGSRVFYFSLAERVARILDLPLPDSSDELVTSFYPLAANGLGQILTGVSLQSGGRLVYLYTPVSDAVPGPSALWLLLVTLGACACVGVRRRAGAPVSSGR